MGAEEKSMSPHCSTRSARSSPVPVCGGRQHAHDELFRRVAARGAHDAETASFLRPLPDYRIIFHDGRTGHLPGTAGLRDRETAAMAGVRAAAAFQGHPFLLHVHVRRGHGDAHPQGAPPRRPVQLRAGLHRHHHPEGRHPAGVRELRRGELPPGRVPPAAEVRRRGVPAGAAHPRAGAPEEALRRCSRTSTGWRWANRPRARRRRPLRASS